MKDERLYRILRPILTFFLKIYFNPKIVNEQFIPKVGAGIIAGNHRNALDPVLVDVCTKRVVHTLAKKELHDGKFGWFFRSIGSIPVDSKRKNNKDALEIATEYLRQKSLISISPEGTRNRTSEILLPFKMGAVVMAQRANCNVIPYAITGDYKFRSKNLKITFGVPLDLSGMTVEEGTSLLFYAIKELIITSKDENR